MPDEIYSTVQSRIAGLAADTDRHRISGVAIGVGDVTRGLSGDRKVWQAEALRAAAPSLEGTPVKPLHSDTAVGEVVRAGFDAERGIVYEAVIEDARLAERVANGGLTVSIEARHADGGTVDTDQGAAMAATDIRFEALALVQRGAAPSASAQPGEAATLSPADITAALRKHVTAEVNGEEVDLSPPQAVVNAAEAALDAKARLDDLSDCGTGVGEMRAEQIVEGDLAPADFVSADEHTPIPVYLASHADDVAGIDDPPTEWDDETWTDGCGPVQYALWGGTATGTGREWAAGVRDAIEAARENADMASVPYEPTNVTPEAVADGPGFTDVEWDGDAAVAAMPNPSEDEAAPDILDQTHAAVPADDAARDAKGNWKLPFRTGPAAPANTRALVAIDQALSGARDGVEGLGADVRDAIAEWVDAMLAAAPADLFGATESEAATTDDPTGARPSGRDSQEVTMTDDNETDDPDPQERVTELKATLADRQERIAELEAEVEQLKDEREEVATAYAEALADHVPRDADALREDLSLDAMREWLGEIETDLADAVEPDVQSGGGETEAAASDGLDDEAEALVAELGADGRDDAVATLRDRYEKFDRRGWESNAEQCRARLATLGVEV